MVSPDNPFDLAIGDCSGEELRRICQEAIARGEALERARQAARRRRLKYMALAIVVISGLSAAALCLCR